MLKLSQDPAHQPQQWVENKFTEGSVQGTFSVKTDSRNTSIGASFMEPGATTPINPTLDLCRKVDDWRSVVFQCAIYL